MGVVKEGHVPLFLEDRKGQLVTRPESGRPTLSGQEFLEMHPHRGGMLGDDSSAVDVAEFEERMSQKVAEKGTESVIREAEIIDMSQLPQTREATVATLRYEGHAHVEARGEEEMALDPFATPAEREV